MLMRTNFRRLLSWATLALLAGCIEPFDPDTISEGVNYVVVDGFINSQGVTTIKLSRTADLQAVGAPPAEARARVYVEDDQGARYPLTESRTAGTYTSASNTLNPARTYRLHFTTATGQAYASAYSRVKNSPPIDSLTWRVEGDAVQLYAHSHDATGQSQYYRWDYDETWEFNSAYTSMLRYVNGRMVPYNENIFHCWRNEPGTSIKLTSTTRLGQDVVASYPLLRLPRLSGKMRLKYSILVTQYTLTPEEYAYWDALRKNTESIGSLFDPLPSESIGNVRCLSRPEEVVLGFVGVHSQAQRRIFISRAELPRTWLIPNVGYEDCSEDLVEYDRVEAVFNYAGNIPTREAPGGYLGTSIQCVDCRLRGTTERPPYWQ